MTAKEFNLLPLSAKTEIVMDRGELIDQRNDEERFTIQTYTVKSGVLNSKRFIEVWLKKTTTSIARIRMVNKKSESFN